MAQRSNADRSADKPNVSSGKVKIFQRSRLYLQLITVFAIALAFCLGISIFFKVDAITVSGNNHYTPWTVAQASGIQEGENLLFFGRFGAQVKIKQALPYVEKVRIGIKLPGTVNIVIEEVPVVYSIRDLDGSWWLISSTGRIVEQVNSASAGKSTAIDGVVLDAPAAGEQAVAWEAPAATDGEGNVIPSAGNNADRLKAALSIAQELERNEILGEAASIHVQDLQNIRLWYADRYEVRLGDSTDLAGKIAAMRVAIHKMGQFQTGVLELAPAGESWKVIYTQGGNS
jgi:cell division protein FtsQ